MQPPPPARKPHWSALAITLLVIGLLILIPSGLCTGIMGVGALMEAFSSGSSDMGGFLYMVLFVGGPFVVIGAALVYAAFRVRKGN
jgi:membrane protein implicated in regulation of membrane protease activity